MKKRVSTWPRDTSLLNKQWLETAKTTSLWKNESTYLETSEDTQFMNKGLLTWSQRNRAKTTSLSKNESTYLETAKTTSMKKSCLPEDIELGEDNHVKSLYLPGDSELSEDNQYEKSLCLHVDSELSEDQHEKSLTYIETANYWAKTASM